MFFNIFVLKIIKIKLGTLWIPLTTQMGQIHYLFLGFHASSLSLSLSLLAKRAQAEARTTGHLFIYLFVNPKTRENLEHSRSKFYHNLSNLRNTYINHSFELIFLFLLVCFPFFLSYFHSYSLCVVFVYHQFMENMLVYLFACNLYIAI